MSKPLLMNVMLGDEAVMLTDRISVPSSRQLTDSGQMHVPCKFARTGSQLYTAKQLGLVDRDENEIITVWREAQDVFAQDSLDSFRSVPVTVGHPVSDSGERIQVTAENAKELQVGMLEGMPVRDEDTLGGTLILSSQEAIDALEDGMQELSAGYVCDIEMVDGKFYQRNIRANHIAIVSKGRAGSSCRISDEAILVADDALLAKNGVEVVSTEQKLSDAEEALAVAIADAEEQKTLVTELKATIADHENKVTSLKTSHEEAMQAKDQLVADAKAAAAEDVVARCKAMEHARLISDMRDLSDKTVAQIERMVVEDQMPQLDLSSKSEAYVSAMFEILVDSSNGETPMAKLLKQVNVDDGAQSHAKPDKVAEARQRSIDRNK